jgi:asparagine synthase (glutamine-hydrolysing)
MSGIVGVYRPGGQPVERVELQRMLLSIAHRGPDGSAAWSGGSVGLGHAMLRTTPESLSETLPLVCRAGGLVITADARLDNRDELIHLLDLGDRPAVKITDSELILAAYERWDEGCPERLLGDFAFAIWDGRRQVLFCARDHFGVKPFYYYASPSRGTFALASEMKSLFCLTEVPRDLNEARLADFLVAAFTDPAITFYHSILRLPPAHRLIVSTTSTRVERYWSLDPTREIRLGSDDDYAAALRELFVQAVSCRMRSAYPLGSMLSGGLDSSAITSTAKLLLAQNGGGRLPTLSAVFDRVPESDEREFQQAVLEQGGLDPFILHADQFGPLTDLDRVLWHEDEALHPGNLYINWGLYAGAQERGLRVILDGFDGDTTVSHGIGYLPELARAGRWLTLARELKEFAPTVNQDWRGALWAWVWWYGLNPALSRSRIFGRAQRMYGSVARRAPHRRRPAAASQPDWHSLLRSDFVQRTNLEERIRSTRSQPQTEREEHYRLLTEAGMPHTLELLDRAAAAFSIELRFPFWDRRLAEFCLALPAEQKMHHGRTRVVMRRAMDGVLPPVVQWRRDKSNLHPSFEHGLRISAGRYFEELLSGDPGGLEQYVDIEVLRSQQHVAGSVLGPVAAPHADQCRHRGRKEITPWKRRSRTWRLKC